MIMQIVSKIQQGLRPTAKAEVEDRGLQSTGQPLPLVRLHKGERQRGLQQGPIKTG